MPPMKNNKELGKRKKVVLTLSQKMEICNRLETGVKRKVIKKSFNVGSSTVSDIKAQKEELLKFLSDSDPNTLGGQRSTLRKIKLETLEDALFEWYSANRSDGCRVSGSMIIERAKYLYKEMDIKDPCAFSNGWLTRFKHRHGIRVDVDSDKEIMFYGPSKIYCEFFSTLVAEHDLSAGQIYSASESKLFLRSLRDSDQVGDSNPMNNDLLSYEERVTVLLCANAPGKHKLKALVVGEGALKSQDNHDLSIIYKSQSDGVMDKELYVQWFETIFVPSVKSNLRETGKSEDSKVLLLMDNCTQELLGCELICDNIFTVFLPTDVTSVVLPMNQGVIHDFECNYRIDVMKKICRHEITVQFFLSQYSVGDAICYLAGAWGSVNTDVLKKGWEHLLPRSLTEEQ